MLRKTALEELKALIQAISSHFKALLWDFMVYTNSASTSAKVGLL